MAPKIRTHQFAHSLQNTSRPKNLMRAPGVVERVLLVEALYSEDPLFSE